LTALLALGWSSLALADGSSSTSDLASLSTIGELSLDHAFERATSPDTVGSIRVLSGPSLMDCDKTESGENNEVCVVTIDALYAAMPAAPAPR